MRIICAPDSFKESISAADAADAMASGILKTFPDIEIDRCPIGDGGEGTLAALLRSVDGDICNVQVSNVFGAAIEASVGVLDDGATVFVESAEAIGLSLIDAQHRDIMRSSSFGVGEMIQIACAKGAQKIIVGVGGSATNDGGCGMAQALGVKFFDQHDQLIEKRICAGTLGEIHRIDATQCLPELGSILVEVACDVVNPLIGLDGAAPVYAPQKGATARQVQQLDADLGHLAQIVARDLNVTISTVPSAGAGGGLAGGLLAFANAKLTAGIEVVLSAVEFDRRLKNSDLCLTGEGSLDSQSGYGKACAGVARHAYENQVPVVALIGQLGTDFQAASIPGLTETRVIGPNLPRSASMRQAGDLLASEAAATTADYLAGKIY